MRASPVIAQLSIANASGRYTSSGATSSTIDGTTIYSSPGSAGGNDGWQAKWIADIEL